MANKLQIKISKDEFLKKPTDEQNWMLFMAISEINGSGCQWARNHYKKFYPIVTAAAFVGGAIAVMVRQIFF